MTTLDPRGLEAASEVFGDSIGCPEITERAGVCHGCERRAEKIITAYLDAAQPTITTVEDLKELPAKAVVLCADDFPYWLHRRSVQGWWYRPADREDFSEDELPLPARVIWRPHESP